MQQIQSANERTIKKALSKQEKRSEEKVNSGKVNYMDSDVPCKETSEKSEIEPNDTHFLCPLIFTAL